ncbi:hypothetical protein BH11CYA1_BH11CYA1_12420 [soil metagenome]
MKLCEPGKLVSVCVFGLRADYSLTATISRALIGMPVPNYFEPSNVRVLQ